jgi:hypothetical protein
MAIDDDGPSSATCIAIRPLRAFHPGMNGRAGDVRRKSESKSNNSRPVSCCVPARTAWELKRWVFPFGAVLPVRTCPARPAATQCCPDLAVPRPGPRHLGWATAGRALTSPAAHARIAVAKDRGTPSSGLTSGPWPVRGTVPSLCSACEGTCGRKLIRTYNLLNSARLSGELLRHGHEPPGPGSQPATCNVRGHFFLSRERASRITIAPSRNGQKD